MRHYDDGYPTCVRTYATLKFYHTDNSPDVVSEALGIEPSKSQVRGLNMVNGKEVKRPIYGWFLCSRGEFESKDVRRHIDWILDQIRGSKEAIESLRQVGWRARIDCFWLSVGHGGPMLDPSQMYDLSKLNLTCGFNIHLDDGRDTELSIKAS